MLPSRDSGCKGTNKSPNEQTFSKKNDFFREKELLKGDFFPF